MEEVIMAEETVRPRRAPVERLDLKPGEFRALREATGLGQKEFGALLGKNLQTANRWESPERADGLPPPDYAVAAALLLAQVPPRDRAEAVEAIMAEPGPMPAIMLLATLVPGDRASRVVAVAKIAKRVAKLSGS